MKKILAVIMILISLLSAASCGGGGAYELVLVPDDGISPTAIYAMAVNIAQDPKSFAGKTVQAEGVISYSSDSSTGYYLRITDGTACCNIDLDLKLADGLKAPEDMTYIRITGTLATFKNTQGTDTIRFDADTLLDQAELEKLYEE